MYIFNTLNAVLQYGLILTVMLNCSYENSHAEETVFVHSQSSLFSKTHPESNTSLNEIKLDEEIYAFRSIYQSPVGFQQSITTPEIVIRGQSPTFVDPNAPATAQLPYPNVQQPTIINPYGNQGLGFDPFQAPPGAIMAPGGAYGSIDPYTGLPVAPSNNQLNGSQPYRFGWTHRLNGAYVFDSSTNPTGSNTNTGDLTVWEVDYIMDYVTMGPNGWVWTWSPEVNYRELDGPNSPNLAPNVFRFAQGIRLDSPDVSGWHWQGSFTPAITTDFEKSLTSDALQFDAQLALFYRASPELLFAAGAMYWDRVDDIVLPFGGLVWTPNQYWEFRLVFPRPQVDLFLGSFANHAWWLYGGAEYRVESYEIEVSPPGLQDQLQYSEYRAFGGIRKDNGWLTSYLEVGYSFNREFEFKQTTQAFDADDALFLRAGLKY